MLPELGQSVSELGCQCSLVAGAEIWQVDPVIWLIGYFALASGTLIDVVLIRKTWQVCQLEDLLSTGANADKTNTSKPKAMEVEQWGHAEDYPYGRWRRVQQNSR